MRNGSENKTRELAPSADAAPVSVLNNKNLRRSERVFLNLRVRVSTPTERGEDFLGEGYTVEVSHDGASIAVDRDLRVGQALKIRRVGVNKEAPARVIGRYKDNGPAAHVYGIILDDNRVNLWDIIFPSAADLDKAVLRALLRCVACGRLEVCYLTEFEADLFLNHHSVARLCGQCGGWTTWTRPYGKVPAGSESAAPETAAASLGNHRSSERLRAETVGCVRHPFFGNDVVLVSDLARGGLRFLSKNQYPEGARLEMAIPYSSQAPNIYSLVNIISSRKEEHSDLTQYRAVYLV